MELSFETDFDINVVLACMSNAGDLADICKIAQTVPHIRLVYEDDTLMRELTQWAGAAFACGLIESPRIERM